MSNEDKIKTFYSDALIKLRTLISKVEIKNTLIKFDLNVPDELNNEISYARNEFDKAEKLLKSL